MTLYFTIRDLPLSAPHRTDYFQSYCNKNKSLIYEDFKDTPIIPKFSLYVLKLGPDTKSRSLNTILVVSGGHDVIMTFYENFVNLQFLVIFARNFPQILNRGR